MPRLSEHASSALSSYNNTISKKKKKKNIAAFVLSPAAEIPGVINYLSSEGRKIYGSETYKILDEMFKCVPEDLTQLLDNFRDRERNFGWDNEDGILEIPTDKSDTMSYTENLINHYGSVNLERVREFEEQYIALMVGTTQDTCMMYH